MQEFTKLTEDGLSVPLSYKLKFSFYLDRNRDMAGFGIWLTVKWQTDNNKEKPYLEIYIGSFEITVGWLWARNKEKK